jgi:isoquinoline 1-oxidoreductase alpha subunit
MPGPYRIQWLVVYPNRWRDVPRQCSGIEQLSTLRAFSTRIARPSSIAKEEMMTTNFSVNGRAASSNAPPATPLLWVIREELKLTGTKFGCGTGLCGACMVHIDGKRAFSCQTQVSEIAGKSVTTIEGLSADSSHPVQKAWLAEQVPQCGYCQSGQIMSAADLLKQNPKPTRAQIVAHMSANLCRCGTYQRIVRAVERAAREA